jgi:hypothetical protein
MVSRDINVLQAAPAASFLSPMVRVGQIAGSKPGQTESGVVGPKREGPLQGQA